MKVVGSGAYKLAIKRDFVQGQGCSGTPQALEELTACELLKDFQDLF
jgi:hypothetical protein